MKMFRIIFQVFLISFFSLFSLNINADVIKTKVVNYPLHQQAYDGFKDFVISPTQNELYAIYSNLLYVIDIKSGKAIKTVTVPIKHNNELSNVVITPDGRKVYLSTFYQEIFIYDTQLQELIGKVKDKPETAASSIPNGMIISPNGNYLYAVDSSNQRLGNPKFHIIDTTRDIDVQQINKLQDPTIGWHEPSLAFNNRNTELYFTNLLGESISIFTLNQNKLEENAIHIQGLNSRIIAHPIKNQMFVLDFRGTLSIIDEFTRKIIYTIHFGSDLQDLLFLDKGTKLFVSSGERNKIYIFDTRKMHIINSINIPAPGIFRLSADNKTLYVSNVKDKTFYVMDLRTNNINKLSIY